MLGARPAVGILLSVLLLGAAAPAAAQVPCVPPICQPAPPPPAEEPRPEKPPPEDQGNKPAPLPVRGPEPIDGSVTNRVDMGYSGAFPAETELIPPLRPRWSVLLPVPANAAPLSSSGLVVVPAGQYLIALDLATGRERWRSRTGGGSITLSDGTIVVSGDDVEAFDLATGNLRWRHHGSAGGREPLLVSGGVVYAGDALSLADGSVLRDRLSGYGYASGDVLDAQRLYDTNPCRSAGVDRGSLDVVWDHSSGCSTGSRGFAAAEGGHVATQERSLAGAPDRLVLRNAATGDELASYAAMEMDPVLAPGLVISQAVAQETSLEARRRPGGEPAWKVPEPPDEDHSAEWSAPPVVVGPNAYWFTPKGALLAISLATGKVLWQTRPPVGLRGVDDWALAFRAARLGVGRATLLVPAGRRLTAFANAFRPSTGGVDAGPLTHDVFFDQPGLVGGLLGVDVRPARPRVTLHVDHFPFGHLRRALRMRPAGDGFFGARVAVPVTTRFRASLGRARSRVFRVYAHPRIRLRSRRTSATRGSTAVSVRHPRRARVAGRTAVLYLLRARPRLLLRVGSGRLLGGRGRSATRIGYRLPRRVSEGDGLVVCIRGLSRAGLGRPGDLLQRRCGSRSILLPRS